MRALRKLPLLGVATVVLVTLLGASAARAAWTATPVPGSERTRTAYDLTLEFSGDGHGWIGWSDDRVAGVGVWDAVRYGAVVGPAGLAAAQELRLLGRSDRGPYPDREVLLSRGERVSVGQSTVALPAGASPGSELGRVWLRTGPLEGPLGPEQTLFRSDARVARVATGAGGDLAITVLRRRARRPAPFGFDAWVVVRRADGALRRVRVARDVVVDAPRFVAVNTPAVNARGDVLVTYDRQQVRRADPREPPRFTHRFFARLLPRGGRLQPPQAVGRYTAETEGQSVAMVAALSRDRRALVGWETRPCEEAACFTPTAAVAIARRGARFGQPIRIPDATRLALTPQPGAVVAWDGASGVMRADVEGRRLRRAVRVSRPGSASALMALAPGPAGAAALLWTESATGHPLFNPAAPATLLARVRPSGGTFGGVETVTDARVPFRTAIAVAFDPVSRAPAAVWQGTPQDESAPPHPPPPVPWVFFARR